MTVSLVLSVSGTHGQLYWSGASSSWNDPAAWNNPHNDPNLPDTPDQNTDVIFNQDATVSFGSDAQCKNITLTSNGGLNATGIGLLDVFGDVLIEGGLNLQGGAIRIISGGIQHWSSSGTVNTDIVVDNTTSLFLERSLLLSGNTLNVERGALNANGKAVVCDRFLCESNQNSLELDGAKIVAQTEFTVGNNVSVVQSEDVVYPGPNATIMAGPVNVNWARTTTCGTGPGQTPFTITASVASNYNGQNISCNGAEDGEATVSVIGGVGPFSYNWIGGDALGFDQTYSGLGAGTYTVLVTDDGQNITCVDNVQLTEPPPLTVFDFVYTPPSCAGECDGTGTPIVIGGVSPYTYNWGNGEITPTAVALCEGLNTLNFQDLNGCSFDTSFTVELVPIFANLTIQDVICNGTATGEATANPSGGVGGPFDIQWSNGDSGPTVTGLVADDYTVSVTDAGGCTVDTTFTINEEPPVEVTLDNVVDLECPGDGSGAIEISVNGGTLPYTFTWTSGGFLSNDEDLTGLNAGTYDLVVEDDNGCLATLSVEVDEPDAILVAENITNVGCNGEATGAIDVDISGGTGPYTTNWTGPGFTSGDEDINGLIAGTYDLEVIDLNGCIANFSYEVTEPDPISSGANVSPVSCNGGNDGAIDITATGGTPPYDFAWAGPGFTSIDEDISGLAPGDYDLTITDALGCTFQETITLDEPDPIIVTIDLTPISCNGEEDATITASATGGTAPYQFDWTGPDAFTANGPNLIDLAPGTYDVLVTDDEGCTQPASVVIPEPDPITLVIVETDVSCGGLSDGEIELTILGGTPPYTVDWTGPNAFTSTNEDLTGLEAGSYDVTVTDFEGCQTMGTAQVDEIPELQADLVVTPISCNGANDGAIDLTITGGQGPYSIGWAGPDLFISSDEDIFDLAPGIYNLLLVDANGCFLETSAEIIEPDAIDVVVNPIDPSCFGAGDGSIELVISGGVPPYVVSWDTGLNGEVITDLDGGSYTPTITDDSGCVLVLPTIDLNEPEEIIIDLISGGLLCAGDSDGFIDATITGGVAPLNISWTGPGFTSTDEDISGLAPGEYTIDVIDDNGCNVTQDIELIEPPAIQIDGLISPLLCADDLASIDVTISGGTPPYTLEWTFPDASTTNDEDLVDVPQGDYTLDITDDNGCSISQTFSLTAPDPLVIDADVTELDCSGDPIGEIALILSGGTAPYTIVWDGPGVTGSDQPTISNLGEGNYQVTVTDDAGCIQTASYELIAPTELDIDQMVTQPLCAGENTGAIDVVVSGGVAPYDLLWTGPNSFSSTATSISNLEEGTYVLNVNDSESCSSEVTIEIDAPEAITIDADITNVVCGGTDSGAIDATITGGTGNYTIVWTAPGFTSDQEDITDLAAGSYQIDVLDENGCTASASFDVSESTPVEIVLDITDSTCGDNSGAVTAAISGGQAPYMVEWFDENMLSIGTGDAISDLAAGNYFITATDDLGCFLTQPFSINDSDAIQLDATATPVSCNGGANGTIDLEIIGGAGAISISWTSPNGFTSDQEDIADLEAGDYTVEVTDELGCFSSLLVTVDEPTAIQISGMVSNVSCGSTNDGSISASVTGGIEPYTIVWTSDTGFTSDQLDIANLEAGNYFLEVIDAAGCVENAFFVVAQITIVEAEFVVTDVNCAGESTGSISTNVISGNAPYDFSWTGPNGFTNSNSDIALLEAGDYNLQIIDQNGCSLDTTLSVLESTPIDLTIVQIAPSCNGSDGSLEAQVTGGTVALDYQYFWYDVINGGGVIDSDAILEDIPSGQYQVEVFDDLGCSAVLQIGLSDNVGSLSANITNPLCNGDFNGAIDLTIDGLTEPFNIEWTGPVGFNETTEDIADLEAATYQVNVQDAVGCELNEVYEVVEPEVLEISTVTGDLLCADQPQGTILTTVTGGTEPYTFSWTGPDGYTSSDQNISDLAAGCYQLIVTDANGCTALNESCIFTPQPLLLSATLENITCFGDSTGTIEIEPNGGAGGFVFEWTGPEDFTSTDEDLFDLPAGGYDLVMTDANFCTLDTSFVLSQTPQITAVADTALPSCPGDMDGQIELAISGGQEPFDVTWTEEGVGLGTGNILSDLSAGTYVYEIVDVAGCSMIDSLELVDPIPFTIDSVVIDVSCFGAADGSIELEISGGTGETNVFWIGPNDFTSNNEDIFGLDLGTYLVTVGDDEGCTDVFEFQIEEPPLLEATINTITPTSCPTSLDGGITITAEGGTPDYTFEWTQDGNVVGNEAELSGIGVGSYDLMITDMSGCTFSVPSIPVGFSGDVTVDAGLDTEDCFGNTIILNGTNEGAEEEYWTDLDGNQIQTGPNLPLDVEPGEYTFIYVGIDGACVDTDSVNVVVYGLPSADAGEDESIYFEEQYQLGGNPTTEEDNLIVWSNEDLLTDPESFNPTTVPLLADQWFFLEVVDLNGCTAVDSVLVSIIPELDIPSGFTPNDDGMNDLWTLGNNLFYPSLEVEIYNRWGELLYRDNNGYIQPWDGTYNGNPLPIGTYYYVISIDEPEFKASINGPVTIIR